MHSLLVFACAAAVVAQEDVVETPLGTVRGVVTDRARAFIGLPYAAPPVGSLRWKPTQPVAPWKPSVLEAFNDPPGCPQDCVLPPHTCPGTTAESCLFLSVYTPRLGNYSTPAPVMIFIHGGNFLQGTGGGLNTSLVYDGQSIVNMTGVIVVTINYRLGLLGFLYDGAGLQGNYGLMDQEESMRWVQANIGAFGGDPTRVTIFGQSAGAMSIASHLTRPSAAGLFSGAIMQSEPFGLPFRSTAAGMDLAKQTALKSNCSNSTAVHDWSAIEACLAGKSADELVALEGIIKKDLAADILQAMQLFMPFPPTYGTPFLPERPLVAFQAGSVIDVPIMVGNVHDEAVGFIYGAFGQPVDAKKYTNVLTILTGGPKNFAAISKQYPLPDPLPADYRNQMAAIGTDALFICATRNATTSLANMRSRRSPTFLYMYNHIMSWSAAEWGPDSPYCFDVVCHGADLPQVFHPDYPQFGTNYTPAENVLSWQMMSYWASLAANGTAGSGWDGSAPLVWPQYETDSRTSIAFDTPAPSLVARYRADFCDFWDTEIGYNMY